MSGKKEDPFAHIADPRPRIIDYIKGRDFQRLDAIVANWERDESLEQLRRDLGVVGGKAHARRKQSTVNVETAISLAVMSAAMNGHQNPFAAAETVTGYDSKRIERAWRNWRAMRFAELDLIAKSDMQFAQTARAAISILERQDTK
jgi:hypothetical protein